ncbi:dihydrodipicolinate synthase family protein [Roseomonas sp. HJA6]|uniref:Dihydrodipicolinate synthase family protein n=1 Tax=Roseomonas alba TaxID=2846776 RepID=A0ABS7A254_9PROT|nr:dihydrodipicolinate synthase family protein [Neoroseomonas alba]MBW6396397.1 dihydrodipicolinate synthase family protein [Neoroseomonas alba]
MKAISNKFRGLFAFLVTPTAEDGEVVDEGRLRELIDLHIEAGMHGLTVFGSTGAIGSFSEEERRRVIAVAARHVAGRVPLVAGTGAMTTAETIRMTRYAADQGVDAVLVVPITYWPLRDSEIIGHYEAIARSSTVPLGIYNNPTTTGTDIKPEVIARLAELDSVAFVKESSGDPARISAVRHLTGHSVSVFNGKDSIAPECFAAGADGWFSGGCNVLMRECVRLFALGHEAPRDFGAVLAYFETLYPIFDMQSRCGTIRVAHSGLALRGHDMGPPRRPLRPLEASDRAMLERLLSGLEATMPARPLAPAK